MADTNPPREPAKKPYHAVKAAKSRKAAANAAYMADIQEGVKDVAERIEDIAKKHNRAVKSTETHFHLGGELFREKRQASSWNASLSIAGEECQGC